MKADMEYRNFWQDTIVPPQNKIEEKTQANSKSDVIIIGSGITALTTALVLQQEGKRCTVLSPVSLIYTNTETAILSSIPGSYSIYKETISGQHAPLIAKSKREAIDLVEGLINKYDIDCDLIYQTGFLFARTNEQAALLEQAEKTARAAGVVSKATDHLPVSLPFDKAYRFDFQAQMHPLKYLLGLANAFIAEGGVIFTNCIVTGTDHHNGIILHTTIGVLHTDILIYADDEAVPAEVVHDSVPMCCYNAAFTLKDGVYPDGIFYDVSLPGHSFSTYTANGLQYMVATGFETNDTGNGQTAFSNMESYIDKYFPVDKLTHKWTSNYYMSPNGLPDAGKLAGTKNTYIISGLGNNAIVNGSVAAKVVCSLIYNKHSDYEKLYDPNPAIQEK